jgi:hypothetical protein
MAGRIKSMKNANAPSGIESASPPASMHMQKRLQSSFRFVVFSINAPKDLFYFKDIKT